MFPMVFRFSYGFLMVFLWFSMAFHGFSWFSMLLDGFWDDFGWPRKRNLWVLMESEEASS